MGALRKLNQFAIASWLNYKLDTNYCGVARNHTSGLFLLLSVPNIRGYHEAGEHHTGKLGMYIRSLQMLSRHANNGTGKD